MNINLKNNISRMNKHIYHILVLFVVTSTLLVGCGHNSTNKIGAFQFTSLQVDKTSHLFADDTKPACQLIMDITYVKQSSDDSLKDSINNYIKSFCLGYIYIQMPIQQDIQSYADKYISNYKNDLEPMYQKDEQENEDSNTLKAWYSYYQKIHGKVQRYTNNLFTYCSQFEEYTGGAHGIYMTYFLNIDLKTMTPIRLEDLFVEDYKEQVTDLLWNQLMMDKQATTRKELEDMGYVTIGELEPTDNFYLTENGISFFYNVYDIAPYAVGAIEITLPYEMLSHLLSDNFEVIKQ